MRVAQTTSEMLDGVFRQALLLVLGAPALAGCSEDAGIEEERGFVAITCNSDGRAKYLEGLDPARPADALILVAAGDYPPSWVIEQLGEPCASAPDAARCQAEFNAISAEGFQLGESGQVTLRVQLRAARAGVVEAITSHAALQGFLAPVNTPAEAVLLASQGYGGDCNGRSGSRAVDDGFEVQLFRHPGCDGRTRYLLHVDEGGNATELSSHVEKEPNPNCSVGRRPAGLRLCARPERDELAAHFARSAELEAASVAAFETLACELRAHGAPEWLRVRALAAAQDEVRHARAVARLARSFGGQPRWPRVARGQAPRNLEDVALENATEGCVRETYGALVAAHQARFARSRRVRELHALITRDETRHAALSLDVATWAAARLSSAARRRVAAASRHSLEELHGSVLVPPAAPLLATAGLPPAGSASALLGQLQRSLAARGAPGWS
jgi:hypothetical protein